MAKKDDNRLLFSADGWMDGWMDGDIFIGQSGLLHTTQHKLARRLHAR